MENHAQIDEYILRHTKERWKKVAAVAAKVMFETGPGMSEVNDHEVAERVRVLVAEGRLRSRGDLDDMRRSEIRLPDEEGHQ